MNEMMVVDFEGAARYHPLPYRSRHIMAIYSRSTPTSTSLPAPATLPKCRPRTARTPPATTHSPAAPPASTSAPTSSHCPTTASGQPPPHPHLRRLGFLPHSCPAPFASTG